MLGPGPKIDTQCGVNRDGHKLATDCSTNHCLDDIKDATFVHKYFPTSCSTIEDAKS